jgi:DNA-binding MarR family transcriptional regulator
VGSSEESALVDALVQVSFAVTGILTRVAAAEGLSLTQMRLLGVLRGRTPSLSQLADRLGLDRSSVSGLIDRASSRDLVRRVPSEVDRRSYSVELTARGREIATDLARQIAEQVQVLTADMSVTEQRSLNRLLRVTSFRVG